ncbi:MAG: phosphatidylinositol alpha-1,6-mannosyltransferase [Myxococcota bacterium]
MSRWLLITQDFPPGFTGGIASWAVDLALALTQADHDVTVLARHTGPTRAADDAWPFAVVRMRGRSWASWQGAWAVLSAWPRLDANTRVICATWPLATVLAGRLRGAKLGVAFHGSDLTRLHTAPPTLRRVASAATALLPVSTFLADTLRRLLPDLDLPTTVLPMPIAVPPIPDRPRRRELVVLARLNPLKGVDRVINIARALDCPLRIIGDGKALPALRKAAEGAPVTFTGRLPRSEALAHLERAGAILLLPRVDADGTGAEGLGLCLIEAALRETPAIGCATGGVPEAVGPGLLLTDPDAPDLDAIRALLSDPSAGHTARQHALTHHGPQAALAALLSAL